MNKPSTESQGERETEIEKEIKENRLRKLENNRTSTAYSDSELAERFKDFKSMP